MSRWALSLLAVAACVAVTEVCGGKILFPDSEESRTSVAESRSESESRGLWESDVFFLQKLSSLFGFDDEDARETPARPGNLRPEYLPLQFLHNNRRVANDKRRRPGPVALRQKVQVPDQPPRQGVQSGSPQVLGSSHAFNRPSRPNTLGANHQNVLAIHPQQPKRPVLSLPQHDVPPPALDTIPQPSQNQVVRLTPAFTGPLPAPPKPPSSAGNFPYQFVNPGIPVATTTLPPVTPSTLPPRADFSKPIKTKKPTFLGTLSDLTGGFFGGTRRPQQKQPRPTPTPQRVIIPPHQKPTQRKTFEENSFNPSPPEGSSLVDAFQPMFVASPSADDLDKDAMKPMKIVEKRTATTTTTSQPKLVDFF